MHKMRIFTIVFSAILIAFSCAREDKFMGKIGQQSGSEEVFYATMEEQTTSDNSGTPGTKVYADENMRVLWNAGDVISIFNQSTYNYQYNFNGEDGDNYGSFAEVPVSGFISANPINQVIAVYPYATTNKVNNAGTAVTMNLPAEQTYKSHSFGIGANSMIAVTSNNFLAFKNVGGYLSLRLYGDDISVSSIELRGNNHEKIAGKASIAVSSTTAPAVTMDGTATESITLVCNPPVKLGTTAATYTDFWFVVPPTTFSNGFTITVTDTLGGTFEKATSNSFTVTRNQMDWMNPLKVEPNYDNVFVQIADANFKSYCVTNFDTNNDGEISIAEARQVTSIYVVTDKNHQDITSLGGIEFFTNLTRLGAYGYGTSGDNLGQLTSLDVSHNTSLESLYCDNNQLTTLDVNHNTALTSLNCFGNQLTSLDVSQNTALTYLYCSCNQLTSLDVSHNTALTSLYCSGNQLTSLDVSHNTALKTLYCDNNQLTSLDVSHNTALINLDCEVNQITSLDVSHNTVIEILACRNNQLTSLDVSHNTALIWLQCFNNQLTTLDVSHNTALTELICYSNQLTSLDVSHNTALKTLNCGNNQLTTLDVSHNTALTDLYCHSNQLTSLDVSHNTSLTNLRCYSNQLTSLDVSNNTALEYLNSNSNQLTTLDVSHNTALIELCCDFNQLTSLDVSNNTALTYLYCYSNHLTSLDVSHNTVLKQLHCNSNQLTSLDVRYNTFLSTLRAWPQNGTLENLYKKTGQTISYTYYSKSVGYINNIDPADYGTTIVEVD